MLCFEVVINGSTICVAGSNKRGAISAIIYHSTISNSAILTTGGLLDGQHVLWIAPGQVTLSAGDELTIRFVEADTADTPRPSQETPSDDVEPGQTSG